MLSLFSATTAFSGSQLISKFNDWKVAHKKSYSSSDAEASALAAFASNEQIILDHNSGNSTYTLGHNEYSDMTWDEFSRTVMSELYLNKQPKNKMRVHFTGKNGQPIADSVDWVAKGAVTPPSGDGFVLSPARPAFSPSSEKTPKSPEERASARKKAEQDAKQERESAKKRREAELALREKERRESREETRASRSLAGWIRVIG